MLPMKLSASKVKRASNSDARKRNASLPLLACFGIAIALVGADKCVLALRRSAVQALMHGDVAAVKRFERFHVVPGKSSFVTALSIAITREDKNTVEYILSKQRAASLSDAICEAVAANSPDLVQLLLSRGADPNSVNANESSVLYKAVKSGTYPGANASNSRSMEIVRLLHRAGAHLALNEAIECGDATDLEWQLDHGASINESNTIAKTSLASAYLYLDKPTVFARGSLSARQSRMQLVTLLRAKGAYCTLNECALHGFTNETRRSLAHGADPNSRFQGRPAIFDAAVNGNTQIVRILLDNGARIDAATDTGKTALNAARSAGNRELEHLLIAAGRTGSWQRGSRRRKQFIRSAADAKPAD